MEYASWGEEDLRIVVPAVSIKDLAYTYRGQKEPALDGLNLDVAEGEFVVVMGHSGAGKSTLCTSLNGLIPHFFRGRMQGEVRIEGRSTREPPKKRWRRTPARRGRRERDAERVAGP
jgi:energy-coupling factor transporter ATP-binding protein EcfA2